MLGTECLHVLGIHVYFGFEQMHLDSCMYVSLFFYGIFDALNVCVNDKLQWNGLKEVMPCIDRLVWMSNFDV